MSVGGLLDLEWLTLRRRSCRQTRVLDECLVGGASDDVGRQVALLVHFGEESARLGRVVSVSFNTTRLLVISAGEIFHASIKQWEVSRDSLGYDDVEWYSGRPVFGMSQLLSAQHGVQ